MTEQASALDYQINGVFSVSCLLITTAVTVRFGQCPVESSSTEPRGPGQAELGVANGRHGHRPLALLLCCVHEICPAMPIRISESGYFPLFPSFLHECSSHPSQVGPQVSRSICMINLLNQPRTLVNPGPNKWTMFGEQCSRVNLRGRQRRR